METAKQILTTGKRNNLTMQEIYNEIKKAGVNQQQAESILAYMGSVENITHLSEERLLRELLRIPSIGHKSATKIINYFKK